MKRRIVIFTVGFHARATCRHLRLRPDCEVVAFVDNNPAVQGTVRLGLPVAAPLALRDMAFDVVAVPGRNQAAIRRQLVDELGVPEERVWLVRKSEVPPAPAELMSRGQDLVLLLRRTLDVLANAGLRYWVLHSSLLALTRGQDLAHFSDVDLGVDATGFDALAERLRTGFQVELFPHPESVRNDPRTPASRIGAISLTLPPARPDDEPAVVDLHAISVGAEQARWWVDQRLLEVPAAHFSGRDFGHYRGVTLPLPLASPDLLARLYGPDWRTPAEVWNGHYAVPGLPLAAVA